MNRTPIGDRLRYLRANLLRRFRATGGRILFVKAKDKHYDFLVERSQQDQINERPRRR
jgi:hypothetical protein